MEAWDYETGRERKWEEVACEGGMNGRLGGKESERKKKKGKGERRAEGEIA